jgi:hypothetical protein
MLGWCYLASIWNQTKFQVASAYPKQKNPKIYTRNGVYFQDISPPVMILKLYDITAYC